MHRSGRSCLQTRVHPAASPAPRRPFLSPPGPGLRKEGAGGRQQQRAEEEKESKERTVPGEKPAPAAAASPLPPSRPANTEMAAVAAKGRAGSPAPLGAPNRPPLTEGDSSGAAAAGSISARSPGAEQPAGPAPSRRVGMKGRVPPRPITARRLPGPPSVRLLAPGCGKTPGGFCDLGGRQRHAFQRA